MMRNDAVIQSEGMQALSERLSIVEAERFITLLLRESFDYTEWQRDHWKDEDLGDFLKKAKVHWDATHPTAQK
ncbi:hypothetical protein FACS1894139_18610 [Planctomycetales bacterium]|nr:hypothetical protein FACS1894107_16200 [Planctomycetales bacterium]GHT01357.1 hypothetical protein FACS1894108_15000 [Planctomycetales bacterium]GHT08674.1 hypothetical protein FACS1894139_18610 [Planctomycetales bacterium]GHV20008.1 hypothetical protein AGMMS49959_06420 [Planctomycetales bacterium]